MSSRQKRRRNERLETKHWQAKEAIVSNKALFSNNIRQLGQNNAVRQGAQWDENNCGYLSDSAQEEVINTNAITADDENDEIKKYERLRYIAKCVALFEADLSMSRKNGDQLFKIAQIMCGGPVQIQQRDVDQVKEEVLQKYSVSEYFMCSGCDVGLSSSSAICQTSSCPFFKTHRKSCKGVHAFTTSRVTPQFQRVLQSTLGNILSNHKKLHQTQELCNFHESNSSIAYLEQLETKEEFINGCINVAISIFCDGFRSNRHSKKEYIGVYSRVESLDSVEKNAVNNIIVAGLTEAHKGLSAKAYDYIFDRFVSEIKSTAETPLVIHWGNRQWKVRLYVLYNVLDMKESRSMFKLPDWTKQNGCGKCSVEAEKKGRSLNFLQLQEFPCKSHYRGISLESLTCVSQSAYDSLHTEQEGLFKELLQGISGKQPRLISFKLSSGSLRKLEATIGKIRANTNYPLVLNQFISTAQMTGDQIFQTTAAVVACLTLENLLPVPQLVLLLAWMGIRHLGRVLRFEDVPLFHKVLGLAKALHKNVLPLYGTMKCHYYYDHQLTSILLFGSPDCTSSAPFESIHRELQAGFNNYVTVNVEENMLNRFFLRRDLSADLAESDDPNVRSVSSNIWTRRQFSHEWSVSEPIELAFLAQELRNHCRPSKSSTVHLRLCSPFKTSYCSELRASSSLDNSFLFYKDKDRVCIGRMQVAMVTGDGQTVLVRNCYSNSFLSELRQKLSKDDLAMAILNILEPDIDIYLQHVRLTTSFSVIPLSEIICSLGAIPNGEDFVCVKYF